MSAPTFHKILMVTARAGCCLPVFDLVRYLFDLDLNIYNNRFPRPNRIGFMFGHKRACDFI